MCGLHRRPKERRDRADSATAPEHKEKNRREAEQPPPPPAAESENPPEIQIVQEALIRAQKLHRLHDRVSTKTCFGLSLSFGHFCRG